jgi:Eukaryotic protein of unknown function (DUF866)
MHSCSTGHQGKPEGTCIRVAQVMRESLRACSTGHEGKPEGTCICLAQAMRDTLRRHMQQYRTSHERHPKRKLAPGDDSEQFVPVMAFECRGIEPTKFHPKVCDITHSTHAKAQTAHTAYTVLCTARILVAIVNDSCHVLD